MRLLALLPLAVLSPVAADEGHWPQWRGPTGQGIVNDKRVPLEWGEKKNLLWKVELPGAGNSTPVVWGDRIFLTAADGAKRVVLCASLKDGKELWRAVAAEDAPSEASHAWNGFASPSCATDGKHVWAFFGTPGVFCYTVEGAEVWKKSFGVITNGPWGTGASPFLHGDTVIINCDNDTRGKGHAPAALVALEKATGKPRWTTARSGDRGFSTPRLMKNADGRTDMILNGPGVVIGYDPDTGKERWRMRRPKADGKEKFGEPVPADDGQRLFVLSGRTGPFQIAKMPGKGDVSKSHVTHDGTRAKGGHRDVSSPVIVDGRAYVADTKGSFTCYDLKSGKELYNRAIGKRGAKTNASLVVLNGKILVVMDDGNTIVVEPGETYKEVAQNRLGRGRPLEFGASPAVADGRLLLRSQTHLYCVGVK
jgi:outer membrane protein assembly factor BamB